MLLSFVQQPRQRIIGLLVPVLAACASSAASEPATSVPSAMSPGGESAPVATPTTPGVQASASPTETGRLAVVIVDQLVVRSAPGTGTDSAVYAGYPREGQRVWLVEGPVAASGYEWYQVVSDVPPLIDGASPVFAGWVAAGSRDGESWLEFVTSACPSEIDLAIFTGMTTAERIGCLSGKTLEVEGWLPPIWGSGGCDGTEPGWLTCFLAETPLVDVEPPPAAIAGPGAAIGWDDGASRISLNVPPHLAPLLLSPGDHVRVVGHVDDAAAAECGTPIYKDGTMTVAPDPGLVYWCRGEFVVERVTRLE